MTAPRRDERGVALPSPVALVSLVAVLLAAVAFLGTGGGPDEPAATSPVGATRSADASASPTDPSTAPRPVLREDETSADARQHQKKRPEVRRGDVFVEVYNNSGISGLAGSTADTLAGAGWQVVGSDNWYGTIPSSTVYYPERLHGAAKLLAKDLGITRVKPAISPMRFDRLTVILTASYS
ncbi:MAG TPA: LytR C-terminal domain-containing protein [Nocardioidaceae bacterium]|nr:LytR C-terminal domain-containing protein [Nocardioidaceae bacterium]